MNPLISINISCWNRAVMLKECIQSFIDQTFKDWELILIDDGSSEDLSFVKNMDNRIRYYKQVHAGMAAQLNVAAKVSVGKYLLPFGSDDLTLPDLLQKTLDALESNPDYDMVYPDCWVMRKDGSKVRNKHPEYADPKIAYQKMLEKQYISHGGSLWRKEKMPAYDETVWSAEDWEFFLQALENRCKFLHLPERLWIYRTGDWQREAGSKRQNEGSQKVLSRRGYYFDAKTRKGIKCN